MTRMAIVLITIVSEVPSNTSVASAFNPNDRTIIPQSSDAPSDEFDGTVGIIEKQKPDLAPVVLQEVRTGRHTNFDRVVFEFQEDVVPGYHLEYIDRPVRQCGSGEVVEVAGDGWLWVQLTPAYAHNDSGEATVEDRERHLGLPVLKELELICDFEAEVAWVLGVSSPNHYRVLELSDPARLVVDIEHGWDSKD